VILIAIISSGIASGGGVVVPDVSPVVVDVGVVVELDTVLMSVQVLVSNEYDQVSPIGL